VGTIRRPLNALRINSALGNGYWRVSVVDVTGSTQNDLAVEARRGNSQNGDVLVAEFQLTGRGRLGRSFIAPTRSALLFSLFIRPHREGGDWGWLPLLAGQAVVAAIESQCKADVACRLKWPNDILMGEMKVAGLLAERVETPEGPGVIIGIGINVDASEEELPISTATSLKLQGCSAFEREDLLITILENVAHYLQRWEANDGNLISEYENVSVTIGRRIRIELPGGVMKESIAKGVAPSGALILTNGELVTVGDIVHLQ